MQDNPLIINAAITGMIPTKEMTPHVPVTPEEIAADCKRCRDAGASIVHLHARDEDGKPTYRKEIYADILERVRSVAPDLILCVSLSGRDFSEFEKRSEVLDLDGPVKPEMGSLTLGSLNFPKQASVNAPQMIVKLAERMQERGVKPELEAFEPGMIQYGLYLRKKGLLPDPWYVNILLGSLGTSPATAGDLAHMTGMLPPGAFWGGSGIGRFQATVNTLGVAMGGGVRVGLEDEIYYSRWDNRLATNAELIDRVVRIAGELGRRIATPDETRRLIGLPSLSADATASSRELLV